MTQIGYSTQQISMFAGFGATTVSATISAVDVTRSYVMFQGWASGRIMCVTCPGDVQTPKGSAKDGKTSQWAVELLNSTTVRVFRSTPVPPGCAASWFIRVIEYT